MTSILRLVGPQKSSNKNNENKNKSALRDIYCQANIADTLSLSSSKKKLKKIEIQEIDKIGRNGSNSRTYIAERVYTYIYIYIYIYNKKYYIYII